MLECAFFHRVFHRVRRSRALLQVGALAGMAGPVAFTAAWTVASLRQSGFSPAGIQISGLAAPGARDPWIMQAGFLVLGGCLIGFGPALRHALGARPPVHDHGGFPADSAAKSPWKSAGQDAPGAAPWLIEATGVLVIAAGLLRRDQMLLTQRPGSWHNQAHNAVSAAIYVLLIVIPLVLARRLRRDPGWKGLAALLAAAAAATAVILIVFSAAGANSPQAGLLQRAGVSIPLAVLVALAARLRPRLPLRSSVARRHSRKSKRRPSAEQEPATEFFVTAARNLHEAGQRAGVQRIVVVSIIGIDRFTAGYGAATRSRSKPSATRPMWTISTKPAACCPVRTQPSPARPSGSGSTRLHDRLTGHIRQPLPVVAVRNRMPRCDR